MASGSGGGGASTGACCSSRSSSGTSSRLGCCAVTVVPPPSPAGAARCRRGALAEQLCLRTLSSQHPTSSGVRPAGQDPFHGFVRQRASSAGPPQPSGGSTTPKPATREPEQHLARARAGRRCGGAEHLQLGEPDGIRLRAGDARPLQLHGVVPDLRRASRRNRVEAARLSGVSTRSSGARGAGRQLVVLGGDPGGEHAVDALVVAAPSVEQDRVGEVLVGDDGEQRLRQVVVDVRVDAEQHVPSGGSVGGSVEREPPGPRRRRRVAREVGVERVEVEVGEDDVPRLHPAGVLEAAASRAAATARVVRW